MKAVLGPDFQGTTLAIAAAPPNTAHTVAAEDQKGKGQRGEKATPSMAEPKENVSSLAMVFSMRRPGGIARK